MNAAFLIRTYVEGDYAAVAEVYRDAVQTLTHSAYKEEQVRMWASYPSDGNDFRERLARGGVIVAEVAGEVVAFGQLEPVDHVAFLYCKGAFARHGLASAIYTEMEAQARTAGAKELRTEASRISRVFFERQGFAVTEVEQSVRLGVTFERFKMRKTLGLSGGNAAGASAKWLTGHGRHGGRPSSGGRKRAETARSPLEGGLGDLDRVAGH